MKKITLLLCLLVVAFGYAQTDMIENFDGAAPTLAPDNAECTAIGINISTAQAVSSPNSLEIIAQAAGNPWQGARIIPQGITGIDLTASTTNRTMTADVFSNVPVGVLAKVEQGTGPASATSATHNGSGWETLTFQFTTGQDNTVPADGIYPQVTIFPNWGTAGGWAGQGTTPCVSNAPVTIFIDNIMGTLASGETCIDGILNNGEDEIDCGGPNCAPCPNPPSGVPPVSPPARDPSDVKSIYSNAYTPEPTDGAQNFGGSVTTEIDYSGDQIVSMTTPVSGAGLQYQYFGAGFVDLSAMSNMHIDFYFEGSSTDINTVILVIAQASDGTNIQKTFNVNTLANNTWHQMDVAFADFETNPTYARNAIRQVIFLVAGPEGNLLGPVYYDNLYFHNNQVLSIDQFNTADFKVFPNPSSDKWNVSSNAVVSSVVVYDILGKQVITLSPNTNEVAIDASSLNPGMYFAEISGVNGSKTVKLIKE